MVLSFTLANLKKKKRESMACPEKCIFYYVNRNLRETKTWSGFQEKTWISNDLFFPCPFALRAISIYIDIVCYIACE